MVTGFRSKPHRNALSSKELLDINVDPYAYFLTSVDEKRYREALQQRGLQPQGSPDRGHAFEVVKHTVKSSLKTFRTSSTTTWENSLIGYAGNELNSIHTGNHVTLPSFGSDGLANFARQAYARSAPTAVVFDAANFLGELREGLPRLILGSLKDRSGLFRTLGGEYLNIEFGWKPFIRDLQNAGLALERATRQLAQQGQRVHRSYSVPTIETFLDTYTPSALSTDVRNGMNFPNGMIPSGFSLPKEVMGFPTPLSGTISSATFNSRYAYKRKTVDRWFEGEFSSFYPLGFDPNDYFSRLNVLVNTKLTPETLWNLAPWSWLVDWNLRIGDSIRSNQLRANDLLVMHYGYAMERTVYTTGHAVGSPQNSAGSSLPPVSGMVVTTERKRRIRANPYGFGIGGASALTGSQLAILGALGLTKL